MEPTDWAIKEAMKDGIVVLVDSLEDLPVDQVLTWCAPLRETKVNTLPILEAKDLKDFYLILGLLDPRVIILANPAIARQLYFSESLQGYYYNIRIDYYNGVERQILVLPRPDQTDWPSLKLALDRLEELL